VLAGTGVFGSKLSEATALAGADVTGGKPADTATDGADAVKEASAPPLTGAEVDRPLSSPEDAAGQPESARQQAPSAPIIANRAPSRLPIS